MSSERRSTTASVVEEPARPLPVIGEWEVVVCGGGPAGTAAAIAAARRGASVLLLERYGCLGGLATGGLVLVLPPFADTGRAIIGGLGLEMRNRLMEQDNAWFLDHGEVSIFDPEGLKWLSLQMVREAGVTLLHHVWIASAFTEEDTITGVVLETKGGRCAVRAKVVVDTTGDGDVLAAAGVEHERSEQHIGLAFRLTGVDMEAWASARRSQPEECARVMERVKEVGRWEGYCGLSPMPKPAGVVWGNTALRAADALDPWVLTALEVECRESIAKTVDLLRREMPGFEGCRLMDTASQLGVRRSRRLLGEYVLTETDVSQFDCRFDDAVARGNDHRKQGYAYDIPYRSLLPRRIEGLLTAGRSLSCTHEALEPIREIHVCWVTGEAAGAAAAMAAQASVPPRAVEVPALQASLRESGAVFAGG